MRELESLTNLAGIATAAGKQGIQATITFTDGSQTDIVISLSTMADLVSTLLGASDHMARTGHAPLPAKDAEMIGPMFIHGAGVSLGLPHNDSEVVLLLDAAGLRFGFYMQSTRWESLLTEMRAIVLAASVPKSDRPI